jgi:DNA repair protein RadC
MCHARALNKERAVAVTNPSFTNVNQDTLFRDAWRDGPVELQPAGLSRHCAHCDRIARQRDTDRPVIDSPEAAALVLMPAFANADRERCVAVYVDTKHRLLSVVTVSIGSIDHTFMAPREVFRDALLENAAAVVLAHNHPSGDPEPSSDDVAVSQRLVRAGSLLGVEVLDHLVVGDSRWVSLARRGVL